MNPAPADFPDASIRRSWPLLLATGGLALSILIAVCAVALEISRGALIS